MSEISITDVRAEGNTIEYNFKCSPGLRRFFADDFVVEYDIDVTDVPESILVVPCLVNLSTVAWATDAEVTVPMVDETFLRALDDVRDGFRELYPNLMDGGKVSARETTEGPYHSGGDSGLLFSGGVDSTATYVRHRDEDPLLISIQGFDFAVGDAAWARRRAVLREFGDERGLANRFVRMNMNSFLDVFMLNAHFDDHYVHDWVTSVQHGVSLLAACAPLTVVEGIDTLYIASTYSEAFTQPGASHPKIDDRMAWGSTRVIHDGYELTRQEKLERIAEYVREEAPDLQIRSCSKEVENCSMCEKCSRTQLGMVLADLDPADHGYHFDGESFERIRARLTQGEFQLDADERFKWRDVQNHVDLDREFAYPEAEPFFEWFVDADLDNYFRPQTESTLNRMLYAIASRTPYSVYGPLCSAYLKLNDRLTG